MGRTLRVIFKKDETKVYMSLYHCFVGGPFNGERPINYPIDRPTYRKNPEAKPSTDNSFYNEQIFFR